MERYEYFFETELSFSPIKMFFNNDIEAVEHILSNNSWARNRVLCIYKKDGEKIKNLYGFIK